MADETLTFTLDSGNGNGGDVVITCAPIWPPATSRGSRNWRARGFTTGWCSTA